MEKEIKEIDFVDEPNDEWDFVDNLREGRVDFDIILPPLESNDSSGIKSW